ncbi:hypothetical protein PVT71_25100 (plasmid) [Salipiger sp. H15]|uniref:Uncharacterized protein n=1 Tax=Alloyangia sp. H15 TaxID=3029062 RepID=A0AAU8ARL9_9RHOB
MGIFNREQANTVAQLLQCGLSDFDIAQRICPAGEDPELLLEAISIQRDRLELSASS